MDDQVTQRVYHPCIVSSHLPLRQSLPPGDSLSDDILITVMTCYPPRRDVIRQRDHVQWLPVSCVAVNLIVLRTTHHQVTSVIV